MTVSRPGSSAADGFVHSVTLYGSDEDFLSVTVPFLLQGVQAGEPTVVAVGDRNELLRGAMAPTPLVSFLDAATAYGSPPAAVQGYLDRFRSHLSSKPGRLRIVGEVPSTSAWAWEPWGRYEAATNELFRPYPVTALCAYDIRVTPDDVLDEVRRLHPYLAQQGTGEPRPNARFGQSDETRAGRGSVSPDSIQRTMPVLDLVDPSPAEARHAVAEAARRTELSRRHIENLIYGVSEMVTNALVHGRPPVRLRVWSAKDRMVARIGDGGSGPADPFVGLAPPSLEQFGGRGLWMTHQMCAHVVHSAGEDGFAVTITVGAPVHSPAA